MIQKTQGLCMSPPRHVIQDHPLAQLSLLASCLLSLGSLGSSQASLLVTPEGAGHRDPCRWPLPPQLCLPPNTCTDHSLTSFKSGLSMKPTGRPFNPPFNLQPSPSLTSHFQLPFALSRTRITFKHRHIYLLYLMFIICLFLLEFNCTERSVLLIRKVGHCPPVLHKFC